MAFDRGRRRRDDDGGGGFGNPKPAHASADRSPFFRPSRPPSSSLRGTTIAPPAPPSAELVDKREGDQKPKRKEQEAEAEAEAKSGIIGTTANNISVIVGAGIVGMPYALRESGFVAGVVMMVAVAVLTEKSLRLLVETGKYLNVPSYETLMEACFGYAGFVFISINMFITSYGGCLGFMIIIKDTIPSLLGVDVDDVPLRNAILVVSSLAIILPLSLQRDMANLAKTSYLCVINDIIVVLIVACTAPIQDGVRAAGGWVHVLTHDTWEPSTIFVGLGVLSFAFVCQDSSFLIAGSLERPTKERWAAVTGLSLFMCGTLALVCGVSGYLAFGMNTEGNILNNLVDPDTGASATAARALLGIAMFLVYPLSSYVARHVVIVLLFRGRTAHEGDDHSVLARRDRRIFTTVLVYLLSLGPALVMDDLGVVLGLAGAVGASCIAYIGPGVTYLAAHGTAFLEGVEGAWGVDAATAEEWLWRHPRWVSVRRRRWRRRGQRGTSPSESEPLTTPAQPTSSERMEPLEQDSERDRGGRDGGEGGRCCTPLWNVLAVLTWYGLLMPLWCGIASLGDRGVREYEEERALKSPRPSRWLEGRMARESARVSEEDADNYDRGAKANGKRDRNGAPRYNDGDGDSPRFQPVAKSHSIIGGEDLACAPKMMLVSPSDYGAVAGAGAEGNHETPTNDFGDRAISKAIAESIKRQQNNSALNGDRRSDDGNVLDSTEVEPVPTWWDFLVAISYVLLGVVAVTAGIVSISMEG